MSQVKRRRFSPEFKQKLVELSRREGCAVAGLAREYDIRPSVLWQWIRASKEREASDAGGGADLGESADAELKRLRREVERLRQERDFLRSATVYFAKESKISIDTSSHTKRRFP